MRSGVSSPRGSLRSLNGNTYLLAAVGLDPTCASPRAGLQCTVWKSRLQPAAVARAGVGYFWPRESCLRYQGARLPHLPPSDSSASQGT
jgi:hypothetical protein